MEKDPRKLEEILGAYQMQLRSLDMDMPSMYLEGKNSSPEKALIIDADIEHAPDLSAEIDRLWDEIDNRRFSPEPRRSLWNVSAAALAGLALGAMGVYVYKMPAPEAPIVRQAGEGFRIESIPFPSEQTIGLAIIHGAFLSIDAASGQAILLNPGSAEVVREIPFPNSNVSGITAGANQIFSSDAHGGWIYRHDPSSMAILEKLPSPGQNPGAIFWDGNSLWSVDTAAGKLFRHADEEGLRVLASREIPLEQFAAISRSGDYLWLVSANDKTIRRYRIGKGLDHAGTASLQHILPPESRLTGLTIENDWAWVMTDAPAELHRIPLHKIRF